MCILPLVPFGIGHALFTTMQAPTVPKIVKNPAHLPRIFTYLKIAESLGITFFVYMAGYIRQATNSFTGVTLLLMCTSIVSMTASFLLMHETKAMGTKMIDIESFKENIKLLRSYVEKFFSAKMSNSGSAKAEGKGRDEASDSESSPTKVKISDKNSSNDM